MRTALPGQPCLPVRLAGRTRDPGPDRARPAPVLRRRGLLLAALTIAWNTIEAVVAIAAGIAAGSIALVSFGLDSIVEVMSAFVVAWQFRGELRGGYDAVRERIALRLIAVSFFVLATYVVVESLRDLLLVDGEASESTVGIALAALSLAVMPALAVAKRRTAARLGSPTLRADAAETMLCAWLSAALLGGLLLNAAAGWWWADPLAAIAIAGLAVKEGFEAWHDDSCGGDESDGCRLPPQVGSIDAMKERHKVAVLRRLRIARGHLDGVIRMVENEAYCPDVMKQLSAVQGAVQGANRLMLRNHLETCVAEAMQSGRIAEIVDELMEALRFDPGPPVSGLEPAPPPEPDELEATG